MEVKNLRPQQVHESNISKYYLNSENTNNEQNGIFNYIKVYTLTMYWIFHENFIITEIMKI